MSITTDTASRDAEHQTASAILARLDRLPATRHIWILVTLLSLGGMFEFYDLFMTGYVIPGLVKAGMLTGVSLGMFSGPALFVASTFFGLFIGTFVFGFVADKYGRRAIFTFSMLAYCAATLVMAFQTTGLGVCLWRMIAGVGIGVELVTIDAYIAELVPKHCAAEPLRSTRPCSSPWCPSSPFSRTFWCRKVRSAGTAGAGWWRSGPSVRCSFGFCDAAFPRARAGSSIRDASPRPRQSLQVSRAG